MFDNETRTMIANDRIEQLRAAAQASATPLRLTLGDWLIRAGRRLAPACESSAFAHKPLARRAH